jgi:hypothetical protein
MQTRDFYISNGGEQLGPFKLDELKGIDIDNETLVWYDGLGEGTADLRIELIYATPLQ